MPVVYTALIGAYERLNEQPMAARSSLPFVCLTDDLTLTSDTWKIEVVEPAFEADPIRSSRRLKILGHPLLDAAGTSLWIDNSVVLDTPPEEILDTWLASADLALPRHSYRASLLDEFDAVLSLGLDDPVRVYEQMQHYYDAAPDLLARAPLWTAILARRHTASVRAFGATWYEHVLRYSRRDQLSVLMAILRTPELEVLEKPLDNHSSDIHHWPEVVGRERSVRARDPFEARKPLMARLSTLERTVAAMEEQVAAEAAGAAALSSQLEVRSGEVAHAQALAGDLERQVTLLKTSNTWRAGRVLAAIAGPLLRRVRRPVPPGID